jgi:hypothetical protein
MVQYEKTLDQYSTFDFHKYLKAKFPIKGLCVHKLFIPCIRCLKRIQTVAFSSQERARVYMRRLKYLSEI